MTIANDSRLRARHAPRIFIELTPSMRALVETAIESLLLLLDEIDGDADFEEYPDHEAVGGDEPSLRRVSRLREGRRGPRAVWPRSAKGKAGGRRKGEGVSKVVTKVLIVAR